MLDRLDSPPPLALVGAADGQAGKTVQWTIERARAVARRGSLPRNAVLLESSLTAMPERVCVGTFVLTDKSLLFTTMSEDGWTARSNSFRSASVSLPPCVSVR